MSIRDTIQPIEGIKSVMISSKLSFIFTQSSGYFQISDLESEPFILDGKMLKRLQNKDKMNFYREYDNLGKLVKSQLY